VSGSDLLTIRKRVICDATRRRRIDQWGEMMDVRDRATGEIAFAALAACLLIGVLVMVTDPVVQWRKNVFENQALTGWLQGLGSLAAVWAALWLANEQHRRAAQARADEVSDAIAARAMLIGRATDFALKLVEAQVDDKQWGNNALLRHFRYFKEVHEAIRRIRLEELRTHQDLIELVTVREYLDELEPILERGLRSGLTEGEKQRERDLTAKLVAAVGVQMMRAVRVRRGKQ